MKSGQRATRMAAGAVGTGGRDLADRREAIEWPTLALVLLCHLVWALGTTVLASLWLPLGFIATMLAITLHSSLQHEVLHGHPFRARALNEALVMLPFGLVFPYGRFRDLHLAHHRDEMLTDPYDDPESNYLDPVVWNRLPAPVRAILRVNNTLAGRMVIGPVISVIALLRADLGALRHGSPAETWPIRRDWLLHLAGLVPVGIWLCRQRCRLPSIWRRPGAALPSSRSAPIWNIAPMRWRAAGRSSSSAWGPLSFLFLNNNLHVVHTCPPQRPVVSASGAVPRPREDYRAATRVMSIAPMRQSSAAISCAPRIRCRIRSGRSPDPAETLIRAAAAAAAKGPHLWPSGGRDRSGR